ncbi:hypothetical protein [Sphaerotilus sp.]|uniref:hypothetical protein n=1 Tax=Sphaerotilus sp. TaxID=2093942 RepID=UPI00286DF6E3|nr:hypothetical protein [Sphaerotilus sp.]
MTSSAHRSLADIQRQIHALGAAVPFVVNHRLTRIAAAGAQPSAIDQQEFTAMGMEKLAALQESMQAMTLASLDASQKLATVYAHWAAAPWSMRPSQTAWTLMTDTPLAVLSAGLSPVSERAGDNARRLGQQPGSTP